MLVQAIGAVLPLAVAVALSPIPIIAVVLMLGTPRARSNGPAFAVGWVLGLLAVMVIVTLVTSGADTSSSVSDGVNWMQVGIGLLFLGMARRQWAKRPKPGEEPEMPAWMATVDQLVPGKAFVLGAALSGVNPKNLALTASAAATISQQPGLSGSDTFLAELAFIVIGSITVVGAVLFYLVATERATATLGTVKDFMATHNAVIMMVILLLIGVKVLGQGLGGVAT